MYAINHAATALVIKKRYPSVPLLALLIAVQFVEVLWVVFNYLGIEHTTLVGGVTRLTDMPWSHSVATMLLYSVAAWAILRYGFNRNVLAIAIGLAIGSHLVLDLATHLPDMQLAPGIDTIRLGSGLYAIPLLAFLVESAYGIACWRIFGGKLLAGIVVNNLINLPLFFAGGSARDPNGASAPTNYLAVSVVALEIVVNLGGRLGLRALEGSDCRAANGRCDRGACRVSASTLPRASWMKDNTCKCSAPGPSSGW